ncbi:MAG: ASPIC/UnbV domain-containing protein [Roseobacter sp.]
MAFSPIEAHFGLGRAQAVSLIEVKWPDGKTDTIFPQDLHDGKIVISRN